MHATTIEGLKILAVILLTVAIFFIGGLIAIMWLFDRDTLALIFWQ